MIWEDSAQVIDNGTGQKVFYVVTLLVHEKRSDSMIKTLQKHGNSQALVIDKALMVALGVETDTPLQVTVSGNSLIVTPVNVGVGREAVAESIEKLRPRYGRMLKNLAE